LQQVILNLVVNACDAMADTPRADRHLTITTEADGRAVHLAVADRGTGIAHGMVESVFEPFNTTKAHGLGLGLAICRSIMTSHGGRLWAVNNEDKGATFHVMLPREVPTDVGPPSAKGRRATDGGVASTIGSAPVAQHCDD
jgi:C4-dicarboxylate-specific signal transduction histidine kinase